MKKINLIDELDNLIEDFYFLEFLEHYEVTNENEHVSCIFVRLLKDESDIISAKSYSLINNLKNNFKYFDCEVEEYIEQIKNATNELNVKIVMNAINNLIKDDLKCKKIYLLYYLICYLEIEEMKKNKLEELYNKLEDFEIIKDINKLAKDYVKNNIE